MLFSFSIGCLLYTMLIVMYGFVTDGALDASFLNGYLLGSFWWLLYCCIVFNGGPNYQQL